MGCREWDVIVAGGGPAGSATAARLATRGYRVLLVERDQFPRQKPCGEVINPGGVQALDRLGVLDAVKASGAQAIHGWKVRPALGAEFVAEYGDCATALALSRSQLDVLLLDNAKQCGAKIWTGAKVLSVASASDRTAPALIVQDADGRKNQFSARLVIGADGLRSVLMRRLRLVARRPRLRKIALTAHLRSTLRTDGYGHFIFTDNAQIGIAQVADGVLNVVVVLTENELRGMAGRKAEYFDQVVSEVHCLANASRITRVLATGPFDVPTRSSVAAGVMLVGDAAGYYDPFTGQGIYRALRSAELAAEVADAALRDNDSSMRKLMPYHNAQRRAFAGGERLQHLIEAVISRRLLFGGVAEFLRRCPRLADALLAETGDVHPHE